MSDEEVIDLLEEEDKKEDEELMKNLIHSIEVLKQENPPSPDSSEQEIKEKVEPVESNPPNSVNLDSLSLSELRILLDRVNQARDYNSQLQGVLLFKEVKLLSIKRQVSASKKQPQKDQNTEEQKTDVGRYYVKFKAPYFKNNRNFAGYIIVPESKLPVTSQRYETQAGQWNKAALKDLETNVRHVLSSRSFREMMRTKPKNYEEKKQIIERYTFLRKHAPMNSLIGPDFDDIIDWCQVASKLKKDYTPNECQKAWNIFLKPEINKKKWTVVEKENLKRIALEHNYEDWDAIAYELNTNRNGYQCFHLYVDKIMKLVEGDWSKAEEEFLTKLVKECTYGEKVLWHKVAYFFETRTITQIYRKWTLSCVGKEVVAGAFTEEEDRTIMDMLMVNKGQYNIGQVAKKLNRITSQIRYRFAQLKSSLLHKYGEWSLEEDKLLMEMVEKFGKKNWSLIAEHMPNRGRVQIRHRYTNIRKKLAKNPDLSLESLARFKRPVHTKRKESNLKFLMEVAGMDEQLSDVNTDAGIDTSLRTAEHILGREQKRRRSAKSEPIGDLSPCRYPEMNEDSVPGETNQTGRWTPELEIPNILLSPDEDQPITDPLALKTPTPKKQGAKTTATRTSKAAPKRILAPSSDSPVKEPSESEDEELEQEPKHRNRSNETHRKIVDFYALTADFSGELTRPSSNVGVGFRRRGKAETLNSVLKFTPYKYFDSKNADWTYDADRTDPYYEEVFKMIENKREDEDEADEEEEKIVKDERLLPPCLINVEGFYNLMVDLGFTEEDLIGPDDKFDKELKKLYCEDEETVAAVNTWKKRLASLFAWPAALSEIAVQKENESDAVQDRPSTSKSRSKSTSKRQVVKTEPVGDDECVQLSNLDLTDEVL